MILDQRYYSGEGKQYLHLLMKALSVPELPGKPEIHSDLRDYLIEFALIFFLISHSVS